MSVDLKTLIREVPDFPKPGILFYDITTLLKDAAGFRVVTDQLVEAVKLYEFSKVIGIESRGFIFGGPLADRMNLGFVPIRKPGKLPAETIEASYSLEYGTNAIVIHKDAVGPGEKVLIVDDLLATGGTAEAAIQLVEQLGGVVSCIAFVIELSFLNARPKFEKYPVISLLQYDS
ncbi:MAG TPA: adenine phosphoribosyltransferase [Nitrospirales bacterium]|nr:adenine phosphoribosyltransferase [Nitrospirales bacterium]